MTIAHLLVVREAREGGQRRGLEVGSVGRHHQGAMRQLPANQSPEGDTQRRGPEFEVVVEIMRAEGVGGTARKEKTYLSKHSTPPRRKESFCRPSCCDGIYFVLLPASTRFICFGPAFTPFTRHVRIKEHMTATLVPSPRQPAVIRLTCCEKKLPDTFGAQAATPATAHAPGRATADVSGPAHGVKKYRLKSAKLAGERRNTASPVRPGALVMHPKSLVALCVDGLVEATVHYQHSAPNVKAVWVAVSQAWRHIWQLGGGLPLHAISLLHSHLLCQPLLRSVTQHEVLDVTPALVTLLAAKTRTVSFVPVETQLARLSPVPADLICHEDLPLHELVLTGIDMGSELDFLMCLLGRCKRLSVLKLGGNCSAGVLEAARECPLTVLHVSERLAWQPRIEENNLAKILIGAEGALKQVLDDLCQGIQPSLKPFWPDLIDVCTGWCKVSCEFLLLLLVAFPRLQHLHSDLIDTQIAVRRYAELARSSRSAQAFFSNHLCH
ncbi:hypothetical protein GWK47_004353 [Chionoecetes opilio]|uniref:Uncharacterized protein n=1 Tax=Chionoecetes opilio TaxID=41210 RepID=A0A8J5D1P5_CHIOP|nr:hypothetical protein GWK47_004353 [Chionoecetes opilio]